MLKSRFIDLLKSLSPEELKSFREFVRSPFHNKNSNVAKLFELLKPFYPEFNAKTLTKEKLFSKLYPGKKFNDTVMRILLSDLLRLGEEFLIISGSGKDRFGENIILLQELRDRGLEGLYLSNYRDTKKMLNGISDMRAEFFARFELEVVNVEYYLRKDKQQAVSPNIQERIENLIYFTLIELVKNVHDMIMNEKTYNAKFDFNLAYEFVKSFNFEELIGKIRVNRPKQYPILSAYYKLLMAMIEEDSDKRYDELKNSVEENMRFFGKDELTHFLHDLESCCLNRMKYNTSKYRKDTFEVYKLMLDSGTYSFGTEEMTAQRFKNIIIAAVNLNEIEWAEKFVKEYAAKVQLEYRESMYNYGNALIQFKKGEFLLSLQSLNKVKNDYIVLKLDIKSWTLKIYFELGYYEQALSYIDSYRHFLSKNKSLSDHFRERHMNYLKFVQEILKIKMEKERVDSGIILKDLKNTVNVVHKEWLNEKLNDLKIKN
jgi:hypothetical protein